MKFSLSINATAQNVFSAITTNDGYRGWWARECDINCAPGHTSTVKFLKPERTEEMCFRTVNAEPFQKLEWLCTKNNVFKSWVGTTLMFNIIDEGSYVKLNFVHTSPDNKWKRSSEYNNTRAGWDFFMESLKKYCETGIGDAWG